MLSGVIKHQAGSCKQIRKIIGTNEPRFPLEWSDEERKCESLTGMWLIHAASKLKRNEWVTMQIVRVTATDPLKKKAYFQLS